MFRPSSNMLGVRSFHQTRVPAIARQVESPAGFLGPAASSPTSGGNVVLKQGRSPERIFNGEDDDEG